MMIWATMSIDALGYLPDFLDDNDPRPAREQFNTAYAHGGGWNPRPADSGIELNIATGVYTFPDDPPQTPIGITKLRDETILVYEHGVVAILQADGSYEIARMD